MADQNPESPSRAPHGEPPEPPSSGHGGEWENAGRVLGRFAGKAGSLLGKAGEVVKSEYEKAQQREGDSAIQRIWDQARECVKKGAEKERVAHLRELASLAKENTSELSREAAERIARIYTDCTGNPVTAVEVKQVALRFGVMALVTFVTASVLGRAGRAQNLFTQVKDVAVDLGAGGGKAGYHGSFEERTAHFYSSGDGAEDPAKDIDVDAVVIDLE
ncbi:MAG: hypothetical protein P1U85_15280 [Verrucomicrobiales bacterium]|nr:hypothetical protein [Verrucomicrobiales bacterium]